MLVYNVVAYPACLAWLLTRLLRVVRVWRALRRGERVSDAEVELARRRALRLPRDTAVAACVGWLPGAILFPLALHYGADPVPLDGWFHFIVSFALAGLIAVTYSFFLGLGVMYLTTSAFTLAKCVRDAQENQAVHVRLDQARVERILAEHDPFRD